MDAYLFLRNDVHMKNMKMEIRSVHWFWIDLPQSNNGENVRQEI